MGSRRRIFYHKRPISIQNSSVHQDPLLIDSCIPLVCQPPPRVPSFASTLHLESPSNGAEAVICGRTRWSSGKDPESHGLFPLQVRLGPIRPAMPPWNSWIAVLLNGPTLNNAETLKHNFHVHSACGPNATCIW